MLGLSSGTPSTDDTVTLNSFYNWSFTQDIVNGIEHELSEGGMGRVGGLGDQNGVWSTMDLFRFSAVGIHDYTDGRDGKTTYFSTNGVTLSSTAGLSFNNEYSGGTKVNSGDTADWSQKAVFGSTETGETLTLAQTELTVMEALGWTPLMQEDSVGGSGNWWAVNTSDWEGVPRAPRNMSGNVPGRIHRVFQHRPGHQQPQRDSKQYRHQHRQHTNYRQPKYLYRDQRHRP